MALRPRAPEIPFMRLSFELTEAQQGQLNAYETAARHVVEKNAELYRKLA